MSLPCWIRRSLAAFSVALFVPGVVAQSLAVQADGWSSVWTQRGSSGIWDASWTRGGEQVQTVMEGSIRGREIVMRRLSSSDGALCEYRGTIGPDGRSVSGIQSCPGAGNLAWSGQVQGRWTGPIGGPVGGPAGGAIGGSLLDSIFGSRGGGNLYVNADGWTSTWQRRGSSGLWDAVWIRGGDRVTTVMQGSVQGDQVYMRRISSSDGVLCEYRGSLTADRRAVTGSQSCPGHSDIAWTGQFGAAGAGPIVPPGPAPVSGNRYRFENLAFSRPDRSNDPSRMRDFVIDLERCTVRELGQGSDQGQQQPHVLVCEPNQRLAFATYRNGQVMAEYDWVFRDNGRTAIGVWREGGAFGLSVGSPGGPEPRFNRR